MNKQLMPLMSVIQPNGNLVHLNKNSHRSPHHGFIYNYVVFTMGGHSCVLLVVSVVAMAAGAPMINRKQRESGHFCYLLYSIVTFPQINTPLVWLLKLSRSFLDQFMPILYDLNILGLKYSPLKM